MPKNHKLSPAFRSALAKGNDLSAGEVRFFEEKTYTYKRKNEVRHAQRIGRYSEVSVPAYLQEEARRHKHKRRVEKLMDCREIKKWAGENHGKVERPAPPKIVPHMPYEVALMHLQAGAYIVHDTIQMVRTVYFHGYAVGRITYGIMCRLQENCVLRQSHPNGGHRVHYHLEVSDAKS